MTKNEVRKTYKQLRKGLSFSEKETAVKSISEHLNSIIPDGVVVHCFLPIGSLNEMDTFAIINALTNTKPNIRWVSSISNFETLSMPCYALDLKNLKTNTYGIPEPAKPLTAIERNAIDFVITPLLVCDRNGYRVGYGKGFYDRFFASLPPRCQKIGINYFPALRESIATNPFDIALNAHVSPQGITTFTS
jgi:5-formyltetrahydrofolate cyclo-ligase